jgi:hypothetical protein
LPGDKLYLFNNLRQVIPSQIFHNKGVTAKYFQVQGRLFGDDNQKGKNKSQPEGKAKVP